MEAQEVIKLCKPEFKGSMSVEEAIYKRRSCRKYKDEGLELEEISQLLWATQGITSGTGLRSAPSAGGLYPLEIYLVVGKVKGIEAGIYKYDPERHILIKIAPGDKRLELSMACLNQSWVYKAPVDIVFSAVFERTTFRYGLRGRNYVYIEVGHAAENLYLQAEALGLGTVAVGAFEDEKVAKVLGLSSQEKAVYVMPVGRKPY